MKKRFEVTQMWFHERILRILWKEHVSNEEVSTKIDTTNQKGTAEISGKRAEKRRF